MGNRKSKPARKTVGYLRVSTVDQNLAKNKADILLFANKHNLGKVRFIEEVASGRTPWRQRRIANVPSSANHSAVRIAPYLFVILKEPAAVAVLSGAAIQV